MTFHLSKVMFYLLLYLLVIFSKYSRQTENNVNTHSGRYTVVIEDHFVNIHQLLIHII